MSNFSMPDNGGNFRSPSDSNSGASTGISQGCRFEKHPRTVEATEAEKEREAARKLVAKKLNAVQQLAELSLYTEALGSKRARKATARYLSEALDILDDLGPEFEEVIALKVIRGIESKSLKETVAMMMYDKELKLHNVANILKATTDGMGEWNLASLMLMDE
ncbi:hypothetical protein TWF506_003563 [Arthrobotrys conoides]|uniref:Uncharacterized protein n=1 Tax=Arthrobotrys conoides TaxID=74498 RepID=A0AAN8NCX2_9PEZI